ncbi:lytic transglycosylase domain-containing protein [Litoreibacter arenae]|uniref:Membrane-bound lytic murein transglycosylase D n=1 Tax=Litoreibacter arenae DSM 19593 TaxID=1123360 RepID=S9RRW5_9RHOB|nr:lytic transglycosylase domain-containing protein [Litoreibacter arenae]EPX80795.1 Membrane-bound lytic murein transglycosylase D precursor [Litoreibacter arenae DSM 19593]
MAYPAVAEQAKPAFGGNFTFKKIGPPKQGAKKLITIQIESKPAESKTAKAPDAVTPSPAPSQIDWFWQAVSPSIEATAPGRFTNAVDSLGKAPKGKGVAAPRLEAMQSIASQYGTTILLETLNKRISPAFVLALISVESGGRSSAESHKGAQGLMQLIPDTAARFGVTDSNDPAQNIKGGVAYLEWLMDEFKGDPILALAGYNAGENAVKKHGGVPPYAETRNYVPKVLAAWKVAKGMCLSPPELVSDGCVFRTDG